MNKTPTIHVALPAYNELESLPYTLECLNNQSLEGFHVWICVNQPESFWNNPDKNHICLNNADTLNLLEDYPLKNKHILDCTSRGRGWQENKQGVGMARKTLIDAIMSTADDNDIIVSLDADTTFGENYLASVLDIFSKNNFAMALANPYYHNLVDDEALNRAILRYEIYMRYYALNMRTTGSPYCFTPLGSAMAAPVWACKKIGGLTPKKSGEDFYFLQKLAKTGKVLMCNTEIVYPGTRASDRVFFGTGPAVIKGLAGEWSSYPLYEPDLFNQVRQTIELFPLLHHSPCPTPMDNFLIKQFGTADIFTPLRTNHKDICRFIKACHEKIDGLRILQFLKDGQNKLVSKDENNLKIFLGSNFEITTIQQELDDLGFTKSLLENINKIRNFLFETELKLQKGDDHVK